MELLEIINNDFMSKEVACIILVLVIASATTLALCAFITWLFPDKL